MKIKLWAPAALLALLACATAQAAPVTVKLRVEGSTATLYEAPVTTDGRAVDGGDGTGLHPCDGTNGGRNPVPGPTMTSALADAAVPGGFTAKWDDGFQDFLVTRIGPDAEDVAALKFWSAVLDHGFPDVGGCQQQVGEGDEVLFAFDSFGKPLMKLTGPQRAVVGQPVGVQVTDGVSGAPLAGATIAGVPGSTGPGGELAVVFDSPGVIRLKAERPGSIRSNAIELCVDQPGMNTCAGFASPLAPAPAVRDSTAPVARISGPRNGRAYRRGPRLLRGVVGEDPSGIKEVKLAIRRRARGRPCQWWSGRRERFVGTHCRKAFFFSIGTSRAWSYLMPRRLPAGRYTLDVKAFDGRRNRDERFVRGRNRVVFRVLGPRSKAKARKRAARSSARRGARVRVMVVGGRATIAPAATHRARATAVRASGRRCKVAASTPLAALAAALRKADVGWHVRDFGSCERRRARSSGQLFVDRVARERNRGANGWVYKTNDFAPSVGAADATARRLRDGDRVVWFFCVQRRGSCQPTLRVFPAATSAAAGGVLGVRVRGYDDRRRAVPVGGAQVTLAAAATPVSGAGTAAVPLPGPGRHSLGASLAGAIPAFPEPIEVR